MPAGDVNTGSGASDDAPVGTELTAVGTISRWLGSITPGVPDADAREAIDELIPAGDELKEWVARFSMLIALSASIAAFGLLADSGAVVIGAMLVAPLMTPIMGAAAATVTADNRRLIRAILIIAWGTALAIAVGWAVSALAGGRVIDVQALPGEIRGRTFPGLLDLGIAISAGAAAGYIQPRRSAIAALPGVGIAVALVPPLATVGITGQLGLGIESRNAFLLYLTNLAAIVFSAGVALLLSGFRPRDTSGARALHVRMLVTVLAVAAVAVPLTLHTRSVVRDLRLQRAVVDSVAAWDDEARLVEVDADVADGVANVELVVAARGELRPAWQLAQEIRRRAEMPVELSVLFQRSDLSVVSVR